MPAQLTTGEQKSRRPSRLLRSETRLRRGLPLLVLNHPALDRHDTALHRQGAQHPAFVLRDAVAHFPLKNRGKKWRQSQAGRWERHSSMTRRPIGTGRGVGLPGGTPRQRRSHTAAADGRQSRKKKVPDTFSSPFPAPFPAFSCPFPAQSRSSHWHQARHEVYWEVI